MQKIGFFLRRAGFVALLCFTQASFVQAQSGLASFYGHELAGNRTASGERFDPSSFTAAHRQLPFGTRLNVTNLANGRSVIVRINDRGPHVRGRIIDVSLAAARSLGMVGRGVARVRIERLPG